MILLLNCFKLNCYEKKIIKFVALVVGILYVGFTTYPKLDLISGFSAKSMASGHFLDNRSQEIIEKGMISI
jgi:hypothetical protein